MSSLLHHVLLEVTVLWEWLVTWPYRWGQKGLHGHSILVLYTPSAGNNDRSTTNRYSALLWDSQWQCSGMIDSWSAGLRMYIATKHYNKGQ